MIFLPTAAVILFFNLSICLYIYVHISINIQLFFYDLTIFNYLRMIQPYVSLSSLFFFSFLAHHFFLVS